MATESAKNKNSGLRLVRQILKGILKLLKVRQGGRPLYKPDFSDTILAEKLGVVGDNDTTVSLAASGARKARSLFGPRYFVDPKHIASLAAELAATYPQLIRSLMEQVDKDCTEGISIYSIQGPRLGFDFPWDDLPFGPGQDLMYAKRPHRYAFAPRHAMASIFRPSAAVELNGMIESWMDSVVSQSLRYSYDSNLAVIQRILALSWAWAFLAARPEEESSIGLHLEWRVLKIIDADIRFLEPLLGQSVPNNHLLADRFAAWYLELIFPELLVDVNPGSEQSWCEELLAQTYEDGGSFEHSSHYHEFACEMAAAYVLLAKRNGRHPCERVTSRLEALLAYQYTLAGPSGHPVPIGNAIEDTLFPLESDTAWASGSLRELYRSMFRPDLPVVSPLKNSVIRAFWLLGGELAASADSADLPPSLVIHEQAGLFVMPASGHSARLIFRTGPTKGAQLTAGHMHADLLSICMDVDGHPVIVDAGTYTYRNRTAAWGELEPEWRKYFAGPWAHNGFSILDEDPLGSLLGDFRQPEIPARVVTRHCSDAVVSFVEGTVESSNAYSGLRRLCIQAGNDFWIVVDLAPSGSFAEGAACFGFQFAVAAELDIQDRGTQIEARLGENTRPLFLAASEADTPPDFLHASTSPVGGWVSTQYGKKEGATQVRYPVCDSTSVRSFVLSTDPRYRAANVHHAEYREAGEWFLKLCSEGSEDRFLVQTCTSSPWLDGEDSIFFDGSLLWLRVYSDGSMALRWLGATKLICAGLSINIQTAECIPGNLVIPAGATLADLDQDFILDDWPG